MGWREKTSIELVENFFLQYMAAPIVVAFYLAHRIWFRTSPVRTRDMDIDTGRRDFNLPILVSRKLPLAARRGGVVPSLGRAARRLVACLSMPWSSA